MSCVCRIEDISTICACLPSFVVLCNFHDIAILIYFVGEYEIVGTASKTEVGGSGSGEISNPNGIFQRRLYSSSIRVKGERDGVESLG